MRKLLLSLVCGVSAMVAQSTNYPTALDTNSTLFVTSDNVQTVLTNAVLVGDTALVVQSNTGFAANQIATVCDTLNTSNVCTAWEHMLVTSISGGNVIFVTRGFAGTAAAPHQSGKTVAVLIDSAHQSVLKQAVIAIESALGANMGNIPGSPSGAAVPINKGGTGATTQSAALAALLATSVVPVANGGTGVAAVQGNGTKAQLSSGSTITNDCVKYDANGNTVDSGAACNALPAATAQLQYLGIAPNSGNLTTYRFAALPVVSAADYLYAAQTPGGTLTGAVGASVTLTPCPLGVNGTDTKLRFYISGGTGTAESVASTGAGTCTSGLATGSVTFTPANNHSGAWTIQSSHAGIYEAIAANPGRHISAPAGHYVMRDCMNVSSSSNEVWLEGDGFDVVNGTNGTVLDFSAVTSGCNAISATQVAIGPVNPYTVKNMYVKGPSASSAINGAGFYFSNVVRVTLSHVFVQGFQFGVQTVSAFEVNVVDQSVMNYNWCSGVYATGVSNLTQIRDSHFGWNDMVTSQAGCGGALFIVGTSALSPTTNVVINNVEAGGSGTAPFGGQSPVAGWGAYFQNIAGLTVTNSYFEGNLNADQVLYNGAVTSLTETNNWFNGQVHYAADTQNVKTGENVFHGATGARIGLNFLTTPPGLSTWDIGPDFCVAAAPECASHPRYLGNITLASMTGAFTAATVANYIATESGANNAIAGALLDSGGTAVPLAAGLRVQVKLAHTLQAGANTFVLNGTSKSITSHRSTGNIAAAYAVGTVIELLYDGTQWEDVSQ